MNKNDLLRRIKGRSQFLGDVGREIDKKLFDECIAALEENQKANLPKIIGVSVKYGAQVFSLLKPNRHMHVYEFLVQPKYPDLGTGDDSVIEGFITDKCGFLDRNEALKLALSNGQINQAQFNANELFSEDLW